MISKDILKGRGGKRIQQEDIYESYKLFLGTLVSEPRLKIINLLRKGKKNVSEIMSELDMNQTSVSHNLSRLKKCGFVKAEIDKKFRYYVLNNKTIKPLMKLIDKHMSDHCIHILRDMKRGEKK